MSDPINPLIYFLNRGKKSRNNDEKQQEIGAFPQSIPTNYPASGSQDWRNAVIIGSLIGGAIIIVFALTRSPQFPGVPATNNPNLLSSNSFHSITKEQAENLIKAWIQAKRELFAPPFNRQLGTELTTGKAYNDNVGVGGSIEWLERNGAYYRYGVQRIDSVNRFEVRGNEAIIEVVITEERTLYKKDGSIDRDNTGFDTRSIRYNLQSENGKWKIAGYKKIAVIRKIK